MDTKTLLLVVLVYIVVTVVFSWSTKAASKGLARGSGLWLAGNLTILGGGLLIFLRVWPTLPLAVSIVGGNAFLFIGLVLHALGFRKFLELRGSAFPLWLTAGLGVFAMYLFSAVFVDVTVRVAVLGTVNAILMGMMLHTVRSLRRHGMRPFTRLYSAALLFGIGIQLVYGGEFLAEASARDPILGGTLASSLYILGLNLFYLALTIAELLLVNGARLLKERQESQRALEATVALDQYKALQHHAVTEARDAALGRMVSTLSHGLNSPLGAINSASSSIEALLENAALSLARAYADSGEDDRSLLEALLAQPLSDNAGSGGPEVRHRRKALEHLLSERAVSLDPDQVIAAGLDLNPGLLERLIASPKADSFLTLVLRFSDLSALARTMRTAGDKASRVLKALTDWSRFPTREGASDVELSTVLEEQAARFRASHDAVSLALPARIAARSTVPRFVLAIVLEQLWDNSAKAMGRGGSIEVTLGKLTQRHLELEVTDTGPGPAPSVRDHLFEPFFSGLSTSEGLGLGLFQSQRLLQMFGGNLTFNDAAAKTTFVIEVPLQVPGEA